MTTLEEVQHVHTLLPLIVKESGVYYITDYQEAHPEIDDNDLQLIIARLKEEGLATEERDDNFFTITSKGAAIARSDTGYLGALEQSRREAALKAQQEQKARRHAQFSTWATIISAIAAVASTWVAIVANNSLDKTNAQVEAQAKRIQALEAKLEQHHRP